MTLPRRPGAPTRVPRPPAPLPPLPPLDDLAEMDDQTLWQTVLFSRLGNHEAWMGVFARVELADRVYEILGRKEEELRGQLAQRKARAEAGLDPETQYLRWRSGALGYQRTLLRRRRELQEPAKRSRQYWAEADARERTEAPARQHLRRIAVALHRHEQAVGQDEGSSEDLALWALLDGLTVDYHGEPRTLRSMVEGGVWGPEETPPE